MVAAGMGVCFLPEYTAVFPGVVACPVVSPSVERNVCLVTVAGRRWSAPVAAFAQANRRRNSGASTLAQRAVATFMVEGHFARHIRRMRSLYAARRQALAEALSAVFGDAVEMDARPGGMQMILRLGDGVRDVKLAKLAQAAGLAVEALSSRAIAHACGEGLLLGFTNVAEADAMDLCRRLESAIGTQLGRQASRSK